ncbi:hypothetical protein B0H13DRAFT_2345492 [Mycena leptocephala]|nr:hypothetical protein B0H13DRAFT_2345492 [Mycena leptocephala]
MTDILILGNLRTAYHILTRNVTRTLRIHADSNVKLNAQLTEKLPGDPDDKLTRLVSNGRGKHGLILAHAWAEHYATIAKPDERHLIQLRVQSLLNLITNSVRAIDPTVVPFPPKRIMKVRTRTNGSKKRKKGTNTKAKPKKKAKKSASVESGDEVPPQAKSTATANKTSTKAVEEASSSDSESSAENSDEETAGKRTSVKLTWTLSQYRKPTRSMNGSARVWKFACRHCDRFRCSPRTDGINDWGDEPQKIKNTSNFIKHADECKDRPDAQSWEQYQLALERKRKGLPALPASSDPSPLQAEQEMMSDFVQRGIENPARTVIYASYRKHLVEAIVEDDLAFSVAESGGVLRLLNHLVPRGVKARIPHQTGPSTEPLPTPVGRGRQTSG